MSRSRTTAARCGPLKGIAVGNAIDNDTLHLWRFLVKDGQWWTVRGLTGHWHPTWTLDEVERHLEALVKGGFLAKRTVEARRDDLCRALYAHTSDCLPMVRFLSQQVLA